MISNKFVNKNNCSLKYRSNFRMDEIILSKLK